MEGVAWDTYDGAQDWVNETSCGKKRLTEIYIFINDQYFSNNRKNYQVIAKRLL